MFLNSHKVKNDNYKKKKKKKKKMDEVRTKKIEKEVNQDKIDYINYGHSEEITYWKKTALERVSTESDE